MKQIVSYPQKPLGDYRATCHGCWTRNNLTLVAHYADSADGTSSMVGWLFLCMVCAPKYFNGEVEISIIRCGDAEKASGNA